MHQGNPTEVTEKEHISLILSHAQNYVLAYNFSHSKAAIFGFYWGCKIELY